MLSGWVRGLFEIGSMDLGIGGAIVWVKSWVSGPVECLILPKVKRRWSI
jgi:hypothetical protein